MIRFLILIFFISVQQLAVAQSFYIRGKVLDGETLAPLRNASVYINNSTKGAITDNNGEFQIGSLQPGHYELVASYVGFEALLYSVDITTGGIKITFQLSKKEKQMRELLILPNETRVRYLKIFKDNLLGFTNAAQSCKIKNISEVQFAAGSNTSEVIAYADTSLIIENPELGYTIHFTIIDFYYNRSTGLSYFYGYTRFEDMNKEGEQKRRWKRRRNNTYEGSTQHFFHSLLKRNLNDEGFTVQQVIEKKISVKDSLPKNNSIVIRNGPSKINIARTVTEDSLLCLYSDSGYKIYELNAADWLRVIYKKNTTLKQNIQQKQILTGQPYSGTFSSLKPRGRPILFDYKGRLLTPLAIYYDGIWAFERLANMLPEDFEPD